jgi:N4-gp56 family major capsid protein
MTRTVITTSDAKAVKRWSAKLVTEVQKKSYFARKFIGEDENSIIQRKSDLEGDAGDKVSFDLSVTLRGRPTVGDDRLLGNEENLRFFTDEVYIDQTRKSVSAGGKMTRKRTLHNLREVALARLSDYWKQYMDELFFIYLSGARGINEDFLEPTSWTGHAGNAITPPDTGHLFYGGNATQKSDVDSGDKLTRNNIENIVAEARMMRSLDPSTANMCPVMTSGEGRYVLVMTPHQERDLRVSDSAGWLEIQKAAASAEGRDNPIFKGGLGMINNVVLHSHESVIRFNDYGAGSVEAARALFLGKQAGVVAFGMAGGLTFPWEEELIDFKNEPIFGSGTIIGVKKTRFNSKDFGVIAIDTASAPL